MVIKKNNHLCCQEDRFDLLGSNSPGICFLKDKSCCEWVEGQEMLFWTAIFTTYPNVENCVWGLILDTEGWIRRISKNFYSPRGGSLIAPFSQLSPIVKRQENKKHHLFRLLHRGTVMWPSSGYRDVSGSHGLQGRGEPLVRGRCDP